MVTMDLRKELAHLYKAKPGKVDFIDVPKMQYLMIDGQSAPASENFQEAIQALYSLVYTIKFTLKKEGIEFPVMPLEGIWHGAEGVFDVTKQNQWKWTLIIVVPDAVTAKALDQAKAELRKKKTLPAIDSVRLERYDEGKVAQTMHLGPYSQEEPTIALLDSQIRKEGLKPAGHHEIYLGDPRRAAPEKLRTILRKPVRA